MLRLSYRYTPVCKGEANEVFAIRTSFLIIYIIIARAKSEKIHFFSSSVILKYQLSYPSHWVLVTL